MKRLLVLVACAGLLFVMGRAKTGKAAVTVIASPRSDAFAPPRIEPVLERACHNCHSDRTDWPWYSHIPPVSLMIRRDVARGRSKLDFSQWGDGSGRPTRNEVQEICDAVSDGSMPPKGYRMMHREATLSSGEIELLCRWDNFARAQPPLSQEK